MERTKLQFDSPIEKLSKKRKWFSFNFDSFNYLIIYYYKSFFKINISTVLNIRLATDKYNLNLTNL